MDGSLAARWNDDRQRLECRHRNEVVAWDVVSLAMPLANICASRLQELIRKPVPSVGIAHAHWLAGSDAVGQTVALIDVEDGLFTQHRDQAAFRILAVAVLHLQLLDEVNLRAVLAFAHMAAGFECLLEC